MVPTHLAAALLLAAGAALPVSAAQITSLSPQGEVARVRQVVAKFDEAVVRFGDPKAPAPLTLSCSDAQATQGQGRWVSEREWAFDFADDLPPGVSCTLQVPPGFKTAQGAALGGTPRFRFNTGGPFVQAVYPNTYQAIDEEQYFALRLNGAATLASVTEHVWCAVEGLGERVPVRLVDGTQRAGVLKALGLDKAAEREPLRVVTLACNRRLTPATRVQLVYGKGVATPSGMANTTERRFGFKVREPFELSFSCERENAQAACLPLLPMQLRFNAPVPRAMAEGIRLMAGTQTFKPRLDADGEGGGDADTVVNAVSFGPDFPELASLRLSLPPGFADASGRAPRNAASFPLTVATSARPPLAKFAAAPFGIVERLAEPGGVALLPVTLRNVEAALPVRGLSPTGVAAAASAPAGRVADLQPGSDAEIIAWFRKVQRYDRALIPATRHGATASPTCPSRCLTATARTSSRPVCCPCWPGGRGCARWICPRRQGPVHGPSKSWAFRCRRASMWSRSPPSGWAKACSTNATAHAGRWWCAARRW